MISFTIHDTKEFMHLLLKQNTFDNFCIYRMDITTFALFQIDGYKNKAYFSPAEQELITENYCFWKEIRHYAFEIIKGQKLPKQIKIIFSINQNKTEMICATPANYFLNISFEHNTITCTTGCSLLKFSMDKTAEHEWDKWVLELFQKLKIAIITQ